MCGIAGIAFADRTSRPSYQLVGRMATSLRHRGPDESGALIEDGVGLCMQRLAVIDLAAGQQPIFNENQTVAVVFNGEIYNYHDLRDELISRGHEFQSNSDTEVIVHLYEDFGLDFVQHLHGMFAIAIWDFSARQLVVARDRLGVKPMYYFQDTDHISFGSEIKAVLQDQTVPREIDRTGLHQLLTFGHLLPPTTCFANIRELPPAHMFVYRGGELAIRSYWDLEFLAKPIAMQDEPVTHKLMSHLKLAVARRLISEVPMGAFLSGGIDSGIVVALMSQLSRDRVKTFSIGFDDRAFSELPYARMVAEKYNTDHHELIVRPNIVGIMDQLIAHHDSPFYDTSAIPTYYLSQFAREHVTVALSGDGGDEMFAGYNIYVASLAASYYRRVPNVIHKYFVSPLAELVPETSKYVNQGRVLREFLRGARMEPLVAYTRWATKVKREVRRRLYYCPGLLAELDRPDEAWLATYYHAPVVGVSELSRMLYLGTKTELPGDMLIKVDRMSMAHSLEVRSPLLDHALFEFAATLPDDAKRRGRTTKHLLRQVARQLLPASSIDRPKRGFSIPLDRWMREDLRSFTEAILFDPMTENRGLFDNMVVRELAAEHAEGKVSRGRELWTLLTIELWHRNYIDHFTGAVVAPELPPLATRQPAHRTR